MDIVAFLDRFYENIKIAAAHWNLGEREILISLIHDVYTAGLEDGRNHIKEKIERIFREKE